MRSSASALCCSRKGAPGDACKLHHRCEMDCGYELPTLSPVLTTGCLVQAVKQGTSHRDLRRFGDTCACVYIYVKIQKDRTCIFSNKQLGFLSLSLWDEELNSSPRCPLNVP